MFNKIIRFFSRTWLLYAFMAGTLFLLFNREQVADDVLNASRPSGDYIHAYSYGLKDANDDELRRAAAYYKTVLMGDPWTPLVHANLGFCYFYLHDAPKAIKEYRKAIEGDPYVYAFYFDMGFIYLFQGDYAKALDFFQKAKILVPANRAQLLRILHVSPKYYEQPVLAENSIFIRRLDHDLHLLYDHLGSLYAKTNDHQKLLTLAVEGIGRYPKDPELYYYAGTASLALGYLEQAAMFLSKAIDLAPNYAEAYFGRAQLMKLIGQELAFKQDMGNYEESKRRGAWRRVRDLLDLHHWHDAILFFQVYR